MADHSGWQRALDVQMDTLKWCSSTIGRLALSAYFSSVFYESERGTPIQLDDPLRIDGADMARHVCVALWRGDTIYITSDMMHLIMQAAHDLPESVTIDDHTFLSPFGFVLFEEPMIGEDKGGNTILIHGFSWEQAPIAGTEDEKEAVILYFWVDPKDERDSWNSDFREVLLEHDQPLPPLAIQHFVPLRIGETIPKPRNIHEKGSEIVLNLIKLFVAMNIIAQQKIGSPVRLAPDRAARKRYNREWGKDAPERIITLITLRRKSVKKDDEAPQKVEWSRRWVVRGFWRRQWYPKANRHDWKYIHEYIKGPEDKPLIVTERRIFNFRR